MNFATLIPMLLPLLQEFLQGTSGAQLSTILGNNASAITKAAAALPSSGTPDSAVNIINSLLPVLKPAAATIDPAALESALANIQSDLTLIKSNLKIS